MRVATVPSALRRGASPRPSTRRLFGDLAQRQGGAGSDAPRTAAIQTPSISDTDRARLHHPLQEPCAHLSPRVVAPVRPQIGRRLEPLQPSAAQAPQRHACVRARLGRHPPTPVIEARRLLPARAPPNLGRPAPDPLLLAPKLPAPGLVPATPPGRVCPALGGGLVKERVPRQRRRPWHPPWLPEEDPRLGIAGPDTQGNAPPPPVAGSLPPGCAGADAGIHTRAGPRGQGAVRQPGAQQRVEAAVSAAGAPFAVFQAAPHPRAQLGCNDPLRRWGAQHLPGAFAGLRGSRVAPRRTRGPREQPFPTLTGCERDERPHPHGPTNHGRLSRRLARDLSPDAALPARRCPTRPRLLPEPRFWQNSGTGPSQPHQDQPGSLHAPNPGGHGASRGWPPPGEQRTLGCAWAAVRGMRADHDCGHPLVGLGLTRASSSPPQLPLRRCGSSRVSDCGSQSFPFWGADSDDDDGLFETGR